MPRPIEGTRCPHCGIELPKEKPRSCPQCGGALHQRHLKIGCLSSAPPLLAIGLGVAIAARALARLGLTP
jgi:predicted amidophosphoribosyltransferase